MRAPKIAQATHPAGHYLIEVSGVFDGQLYFSGEHLRVAPYTGGDAKRVLLSAAGPGHVQLGHVQGGQIYGVSGEPCSERRWRVVAVVKQVSRPVLRRSASERVRPVRLRSIRRPCPQSSPDAQLGLFGVVASAERPD